MPPLLQRIGRNLVMCLIGVILLLLVDIARAWRTFSQCDLSPDASTKIFCNQLYTWDEDVRNADLAAAMQSIQRPGQNTSTPASGRATGATGTGQAGTVSGSGNQTTLTVTPQVASLNWTLFMCMDLQCVCPYMNGQVQDDGTCMLPNGQPLRKAMRREYRQLSESERTRLHNAFWEVKRNGIYDYLAQIHRMADRDNPGAPEGSGGAHSGPAFLPWHREFIKRMELALRLVDPTISLAYIDWTMEAALPRPNDSILFSEYLQGETTPGGVEIVNGPFVGWRTLDGSRNINRSVGVNGTGYPITEQQIARLMQKNYLGWTAFSVNRTGCNMVAEFENVEYYHGNGHIFIGGDMADIPTAAQDPIFFWHHSFVDWVWEIYRQNNQTDWEKENQYPNETVNCANAHHLFDAIMVPFGPMRNRDGLSMAYYDNLYEYSNRPMCSEGNPNGCGSDMLFCDMSHGKARCVSKMKRGSQCNFYKKGENPCFAGECRNGVCIQTQRRRSQRPLQVGGSYKSKMIVPEVCYNENPCCDKWASEGYSSSNPEYMHRFCKASSKVCTPKKYSLMDDCKDRHILCSKWKDNGECEDNKDFMDENCRQSCNRCSHKRAQKCHDDDDEEDGHNQDSGDEEEEEKHGQPADPEPEAEQQEQGHKQEEPHGKGGGDQHGGEGETHHQEEHGGYDFGGDEHESSEKGHDSHDKHDGGHGNEHSSSYNEYHQEGGHEEVHHVEYKKEPEHHGSNYHHGQEHKKKPKEKCYNENPCCPYWSHIGLCHKYPKAMAEECGVSCHACTPKDYKYGGCDDYNPHCPYWSMKGECHKNTWMTENCRKSCGTCASKHEIMEMCHNPKLRVQSQKHPFEGKTKTKQTQSFQQQQGAGNGGSTTGGSQQGASSPMGSAGSTQGQATQDAYTQGTSGASQGGGTGTGTGGTQGGGIGGTQQGNQGTSSWGTQGTNAQGTQGGTSQGAQAGTQSQGTQAQGAQQGTQGTGGTQGTQSTSSQGTYGTQATQSTQTSQAPQTSSYQKSTETQTTEKTTETTEASTEKSTTEKPTTTEKSTPATDTSTAQPSSASYTKKSSVRPKSTARPQQSRGNQQRTASFWQICKLKHGPVYLCKGQVRTGDDSGTTSSGSSGSSNSNSNQNNQNSGYNRKKYRRGNNKKGSSTNRNNKNRWSYSQQAGNNWQNNWDISAYQQQYQSWLTNFGPENAQTYWQAVPMQWNNGK